MCLHFLGCRQSALSHSLLLSLPPHPHHLLQLQYIVEWLTAMSYVNAEQNSALKANKVISKQTLCLEDCFTTCPLTDAVKHTICLTSFLTAATVVWIMEWTSAAVNTDSFCFLASSTATYDIIPCLHDIIKLT